MAVDLPDWLEQPISRREWATQIGEIKSFCFQTTTPISPEQTGYSDLYSVPYGKALFLSDLGVAGDFRGEFTYSIVGVTSFWMVHAEMYETKLQSFLIPVILTYGQTLRISAYNDDIVSGKFYGFFLGWETGASEPEKPKDDSPEELFRTGFWNYCNMIDFGNGKKVFIFSKLKDDRINYLKFDSFTGDYKKVAFQTILKNKDAEEILTTLRKSPENVINLIEKIESKYKLRFFKS